MNVITYVLLPLWRWYNITWLQWSRNAKQNSSGIHLHQYCAINWLIAEMTSCVLCGMLKLCSLTCSLCAHVHRNTTKIWHKTGQYRLILPTISQLHKLCVKISILRHRRMWVRSFSTRLMSVTFAEDKVLIFLILRKNAKIVQLWV